MATFQGYSQAEADALAKLYSQMQNSNAYRGWNVKPAPETLPSDTYEIQRKLANVKELRFKQFAIAPDGWMYGLTEDGVLYNMRGEYGWRRIPMHEEPAQP